MIDKWKVSSNYVGGQKVWQVFRTVDESQPDHAGNREYHGELFDTAEAAHHKAAELNGYHDEDLEQLAIDTGNILRRTVRFRNLKGCRYYREGRQAYVAAEFTDREPLRIHETGATGMALVKSIIKDLEFETWKEAHK